MAKPAIFERFLRKAQCTFFGWSVLPSYRGPTTRKHWEQYPTEHFDDLEPASQVLVAEIMDVLPDRNAAILDMGCNVGRHMHHLHLRGYKKLWGIDFSEAAIRAMAIRYPQMFASSRVITSSFQNFLRSHPQPFDLVYTRGATFELVHPAFPLVREVCRITKRLVVMVISESGHAYPRFWEYEFARAGFELVHLRRPASRESPQHRVSLLTFARRG